MALYQNYPYTDMQTVNLDYLLKAQQDLDQNFEALDTAVETAQNAQSGALAAQSAAQGYAADAAASAAEAAAGGTKAFVPRGMTDVVVIGDSYAARTANWQEPLRNLLGMSTDHWHVYAEGSSGFSYQGTSGHTWGDLLLQASQAMTSAERSAVSHIIVAGGANDTYNTVDTVEAAMASFLNDAATLFPNAVVYVGFIGVIRDATKCKLVGDTCAAYARCVKHGNAMFLSGCEYVLHNSSYVDSDGVHPNDVGCTALAGYMRQALVTGKADVVYAEVSDGTFGVGKTLWTLLDNNNIYLRINASLEFDLSSAPVTITCNGINAMTLGNTNKKYAVGSFYQFGMPCNAIATLSNNTNVPLAGAIVLYGGALQFRPFALQSITSGVFGTFEIKKLFITQFQLVLPTLWS